MNNIRELRRRAANKVKWDLATLHQKMGEIINLIEAMRTRLDNEEGEPVPTDEIRVLLNEITRRTSIIDLCKDKFPKERNRIIITLSIADTWASIFSILIKDRRERTNASTRTIIEQGFTFLSDETRKAMLRAYDDGVEEVALKGEPSREPRDSSTKKSSNSSTT